MGMTATSTYANLNRLLRILSDWPTVSWLCVLSVLLGSSACRREVESTVPAPHSISEVSTAIDLEQLRARAAFRVTVEDILVKTSTNVLVDFGITNPAAWRANPHWTNYFAIWFVDSGNGAECVTHRNATSKELEIVSMLKTGAVCTFPDLFGR